MIQEGITPEYDTKLTKKRRPRGSSLQARIFTQLVRLVESIEGKRSFITELEKARLIINEKKGDKKMARIVYRDSKTGRTVSKEFAEANKDTTEKEVVREQFTMKELEYIEDAVRSYTADEQVLDKIHKVKKDYTER